VYGTLVKTYSVNQSLFKNSSGGRRVCKKGPYYTECGGSLGAFSPRKVLYFSTPRTAFRAFSETDNLWIYSVTLYCR
jgi:hypothetical protein